MLGALAGDIIGSVYEWDNIKHKDFVLFSERCFFTDDSILTVAVAEAIMSGASSADTLRRYYRWYPDAGYGRRFQRWAADPAAEPCNSWGNGAAMRISPVGHAYGDLTTVLQRAREFTEITHNHPEGIKGGQATAAAVFLARTGQDKAVIKAYVEQSFGYDLNTHVDEIRSNYGFDESAQGTVPQALRAFLDSSGFEDAVRTAVSLGGDSDTLACITGAVAEAYYGGVPEEIRRRVYAVLDSRLAGVTRTFMETYCRDQRA